MKSFSDLLRRFLVGAISNPDDKIATESGSKSTTKSGITSVDISTTDLHLRQHSI